MKLLRYKNRFVIFALYAIISLVIVRTTLLFTSESKNKSVLDFLYVTEKYDREIEKYEKWIVDFAKGISPKQGELGRAAYLRLNVRYMGDESLRKKGVNVILSNKIPLKRKLKDYRNPLCQNVTYDAILPSASVVIIFHNEPFSLLMRTVYSILGETPSKLLKEIILVDDNSYDYELQGILDYFIKTKLSKKVKLLRLKKREGLVGARLYGAKNATGDVLVFLDGHCEVTNYWLKPLLQRIKEKRNTVVLPIIDSISEETFEYLTVGNPIIFQVGGFTWSGHFTWINIQKKELKARNSSIDPVKTPSMPGGLFAIDRKYFWEVGGYDEKMDGWGGENIEMSFRVWQCGGSIEIVPCSRVGHVFRDFLPYDIPYDKDTFGINTARLAEVWMDDYKKFFYFYRREYENKPHVIGDVKDRVKLRKNLKCENFKWYLKNIYPEKFVLDENVIAHGRVSVQAKNLCLDNLNRLANTYYLGVYTCSKVLYPNQYISLSKAGELRKEDSCATVTEEKSTKTFYVYMKFCDEIEDKWAWTKEGKLIHSNTGLCLDTTGLYPGNNAQVRTCTDSPKQIWKFDFHEEKLILN